MHLAHILSSKAGNSQPELAAFSSARSCECLSNNKTLASAYAALHKHHLINPSQPPVLRGRDDNALRVGPRPQGFSKQCLDKATEKQWQCDDCQRTPEAGLSCDYHRRSLVGCRRLRRIPFGHVTGHQAGLHCKRRDFWTATLLVSSIMTTEDRSSH